LASLQIEFQLIIMISIMSINIMILIRYAEARKDPNFREFGSDPNTGRDAHGMALDRVQEQIDGHPDTINFVDFFLHLDISQTLFAVLGR
jgi:hypothetical protein